MGLIDYFNRILFRFFIQYYLSLINEFGIMSKFNVDCLSERGDIYHWNI